MLMSSSVMTPFSLRDSNQRTSCARSVRVSPHVCCQVYKVQVSVSNIVADATGSRVLTTGIHKYPPSVSCHVPHCSIPSQHISPMMRPNELPQNPISVNTLSDMMTATLSVSAECPLTVGAYSRCATNQDNAHQRHTREVQSSS